jgi:uncharacterized protein YneF (UPF0154 family)
MILYYWLLTLLMGTIIGFFISDHLRKTVTHSYDIPPKPIARKMSKVLINFKGGAYNITDFVKRHPGGKNVLTDNIDKDIEQLMLENQHSQHAYKILETYKVKD